MVAKVKVAGGDNTPGAAGGDIEALLLDVRTKPKPLTHVRELLPIVDVTGFRCTALRNGYSLLRVHPRDKRPMAKKWQEGETVEELLSGAPNENTGLLLDGLRAIDMDIDDKDVAAAVLRAILSKLPGKPLIRQRAGSPRMALIYRAAEGAPRKLSIKGPKGGVDILGAGNQIVVDGIHPSGVRLVWRNDRSPATVPLVEVPLITEEAISAILDIVAPIIGARPKDNITRAGNLNFGAGLNAELSAGIEDHDWFGALPPPQQKELIRAALAEIDNTTSDHRDQWLSVLFAVADAERMGCPDARGLALEWSERGAGWSSEAAFDQAYYSFKPGKTTVGTLLFLAGKAGLDLSPWRDPVLSPNVSPVAITTPNGGALPLSALPAIPAKRAWLYGTDAARGAVSLVVAPGGRGKSSLLTTMALAMASGRPLLGTHVFGGPLSVLSLNFEDSTEEVTRKFRAAMIRHCLTDADVPNLMVAGADRCGVSLLTMDRNEVKLNVPDWAALSAEFDRAAPDVVIMDPLVSMAGGASLNDNTAAAKLMGEFVRLAAQRECGIVLAHHTAKGRDIGSAEAAMGAASLTNLARIVTAIEPLAEADAEKIGVAPWEAPSIFRLIGTKQNLSKSGANDRWFRLVSVELPNAAPPVYPNGDKIAVVEQFIPNLAATPYPQPMIQAALAAIAAAPEPLSRSARTAGGKCYAVPTIQRAIAPHRGGVASDAEAEALLKYLIRCGHVTEGDVTVFRPGSGPYKRKGLTVAPAFLPPTTANSAPT